MAKSIWIVVHGESYIPEAFDTWEDAQAFADGDEDDALPEDGGTHDYISGPWEVQIADRSLQEAYNELAASADDAGCTDDLIVVSHQSLRALGDLIFGQKDSPCT